MCLSVHPSHASLHFAYFCKQKKSTDSKTGLPSVALAKDGGGYAACRQTFLFAIFYAQAIEKFVVAIPDMIESHRITKKVSGNQKSLKCNAEDFPGQFSEICIIPVIMLLVTI